MSDASHAWRRYEDALRLVEALAATAADGPRRKVISVTIEHRAPGHATDDVASVAIVDLMRGDILKYRDAALVKARADFEAAAATLRSAIEIDLKSTIVKGYK